MTTYPLQNTGLAIIIGTPLVATCFVALRIYSRRKFATYLGWDDYTIILAAVLSLALIYPSVQFMYMWHFGIHVWNVNQQHLEPNYDDFHLVLLSFNLLNTLILPLVKASIIILLMRVSSVLPVIKRTLYCVFVFNVLACVVPFFILLFQCPPQTGNTWKSKVFGTCSCVSRPAIGRVQVFQTSANLLTDLLVLPIPFLLMRKLERTSLRTRCIIVFLFMTSLSVTAIGALKIHLTYKDRLYNVQANDWTYNIIFTVNHAENNIAIIVACIPALRGLIMRWITNPSPTDIENQRRRHKWPSSPQARDIATFSFSDTGSSSQKSKTSFNRTTPLPNGVFTSISANNHHYRGFSRAKLSKKAKSCPNSGKNTPLMSFGSADDTIVGSEKQFGITKLTEIDTFSSLGVLGRERSYSDAGTTIRDVYSNPTSPIVRNSMYSSPSSPILSDAVGSVIRREREREMAGVIPLPERVREHRGYTGASAVGGPDDMEFVTVKDGIL